MDNGIALSRAHQALRAHEGEIARLKDAYRAMGDAAKALQDERDAAREAASIAQEALGKANERAERWVRAYERLEAKLRNAQLKAKAVHDALA